MMRLKKGAYLFRVVFLFRSLIELFPDIHVVLSCSQLPAAMNRRAPKTLYPLTILESAVTSQPLLS